MRSTLLMAHKQFFVPNPPGFVAGWLKRHTWQFQLHALKCLQVWSVSGSNERHTTLKAETFFRRFLASHCSEMTQTSQVALPPHAPQPVRVRNRAVTKGTLFLRPKEFCLPTSPRIVAGCLNHHTWHSIPTRHNNCEFGRNRAVTKRTLLSGPKRFFVVILPCIEVEWLKPHMWHSHLMRQNQCKFDRNRVVTKGTLLLRPKQFFFPFSHLIAAG
jgi:hypothetical protein